MVVWGRELFQAATPIDQLPGGRPPRSIPGESQPWYNAGRANQQVAFVFACPGRAEMDWQMPAAGATGLTLNMLLAFLTQAKPELFPDLDRYEYRIVNVSREPQYKGLNRRSLPTAADKQANRQAFKKALTGMSYVLCMGDDAWGACVSEFLLEEQTSALSAEHGLRYSFAIDGDATFVRCHHLGSQGVNGIDELKSHAISERANECAGEWKGDEGGKLSKYRVMIVAQAIVNALDAAEAQRQQSRDNLRTQAQVNR